MFANALEQHVLQPGEGPDALQLAGAEEPVERCGPGTAANHYSLIETCKAAAVNPREYLRDVLLRISTCSDVAKLTPYAWKTTFLPEVEQRRDTALRQLFACLER